MQPPALVVESEQQRSDALVSSGLVPAKTGDDAFGGAHVLHLEHRAFARLVESRSAGFAITPSSPAPSKRASQSDASAGSWVIGVRWMGGAASSSNRSRRARRSLWTRSRRSLPVHGESVERDERGRRLLRELGHPRGRRMQPQLQQVEIEPAWRRDHNFAVEDAAVRQAGQQGVVQLGKVAVERPQVAALHEHLAPAAKDDGAEPVPLRLVQECIVGRQHVGELGEHRLDRRRDGKRGIRHGKSVPRKPQAASAGRRRSPMPQ